MVAPLIAAAAITAGASIFNGITGGKGANKAAKVAADSATKDRALAQKVYDKNLGLAMPTVDRGNAAGAQINALLGLGGDKAGAQDALATFQNATGYQNRLAQGQQSINAGYAARGVLESGAAQKALLKYGQDYASNELGNYMNVLGGQQQAGLGAMGNVTGAGNTFLNANMNANANQAGAAGNAALLSAFSQQQAVSGVANALGTYFGQSSYRTPGAPAGMAPPPAYPNGYPIRDQGAFSANPWGR